MRTCKHCKAEISSDRHKQAKYCDDRCRILYYQRKSKAPKTEEEKAFEAITKEFLRSMSRW